MRLFRKTHCRHGHEYTPENTYIRPSDGSRACRTCMYTRHRDAATEKYRQWRRAKMQAIRAGTY